MKRIIAGLPLVTLLLSVPASAQEPPPDRASFDDSKCWKIANRTKLGEPGAQSLLGREEHYRPQLRHTFDPECMRVWFPVQSWVTGGMASSFPVDRDGAVADPGASVSPVVRLGAAFDSGESFAPIALHAEYEHDIVTGIAGTSTFPEGDGYATTNGFTHQLRKAFVRASAGRYAHLRVGYQTSHWGLGLLANDGAHGWAPGNARFSDPRGGDRVLRAQVVTGPLTDAGLLFAVQGDILDSDFLAEDDVLLKGDTALQLSGVVAVGMGKPHGGGAYIVRRSQQTLDGSLTNVWVVDVTARTRWDLDNLSFGVEAEGAVVTGDTELAPNPTFPGYDVLQGGLAARTFLDVGRVGGVLDVLYASGDPNFDDGQQNGFRVDPNFDMGLLLFRQVLAAHSARGSFRAGDLTLVGVPTEDLDRIPTRGSATNTIAVFPKLRGRPYPGLELYGGPLFAFTATPSLDAFNSRIAGGGDGRGTLDGAAGRYLGTEFDLGARYRLNISGSELTIGAEGAALRPGSAFRRPDGTLMNAIYGGRLMLAAKL